MNKKKVASYILATFFIIILHPNQNPIHQKMNRL